MCTYKMKGYIYILKSGKTGRYYVGSSGNPERRLVTRHNRGLVRSTSNGIPWKIVFIQKYSSLTEARKIEYRLKKMKSRLIIELIISDGVCKVKTI